LIEAEVRVDCDWLVSHGVFSIGCDCVCHAPIVSSISRFVKVICP
jgi:hypothetical protein